MLKEVPEVHVLVLLVAPGTSGAMPVKGDVAAFTPICVKVLLLEFPATYNSPTEVWPVLPSALVISRSFRTEVALASRVLPLALWRSSPVADPVAMLSYPNLLARNK